MAIEEWHEIPLGEFVSLQRGHDLPDHRRRPGVVPILGSFGITGYHDEAKVKGPGVTIGRSGASFGVVSFSSGDYWPLNTTLYVTNFQGNDERFAYYLLRSIDFRGYDSGSAQPSLNRNYIRSIQVRIPSLPEQRAIANILGTLEDKIDLNQRMNKTLEAIARAIFKSWFVDFDPVRTKAEGRRPCGMNAETALLFPDSFQASEVGNIPKGWSVKPLAQVSEYLNRGISPSYVENEGILVLNQKCVRGGHVDISEGRRHDWRKREVKDRLLKSGDVLVNSTGVGTLGRVAQILVLREDTIVDSHVTVVRANNEDVSWNFLGIALSDREQEIEALGEGTTGQTELSRSRLGNLPLIVPSHQVIQAFDGLTIPTRKRVSANHQESDTLAALRDALLPKLISGEIRVKEAEQSVEVHT